MSNAPPGPDRYFFKHAADWFGTLEPETAAAVAAGAGDVALLIDGDGIIRDVAGTGQAPRDMSGWVGRRWNDTVTTESREKIDQLLADPEAPRWRQVNHPSDAADIPIRYKAFRLDNGITLAIGREERAAAQLQQRLLQVQQSLERDYLRLRQAESRYRLLFDLTGAAMLVVEASSLRIREANAAAERLMGATHGLAGQPLVAQLAAADRDRLIAYFGGVANGAEMAPTDVAIAKGERPATLSARLFRQEGTSFFLIQLNAERDVEMEERDRFTLGLVERMPDGFVLTDAKLRVVRANPAFADIARAASVRQLIGQPLGELLGRPGIDLDLILATLSEHQVARNVQTILRALDGSQEEIEVSAVRAGDGEPHYGFSMRVIARRLRDLPPAERDLPRSVEQLTELVGRMPLKDIVRESTDLIERLCIEAALAYTSNNRASAAEILGLSRQSLYSKLHRHGLARTESDEAAE